MNAHRMRADVLMDQRRWDLAETEFRAALTQEPDDTGAQVGLAICLSMQEKFDEAEQTAGAALASDPNDARTYHVLAGVLMVRNRPAEALPLLRQALSLEPDYVEAHVTEGHVHLMLRDWPAALAAADRALELDPQDDDADNVRSQALVMLGRRDEAGATLTEALRRDPGKADTHANLGWTRLHEGDPTAAADHFREALRLEPGHGFARLGLVEALKARNPISAAMLRWFLFLGRKSAGTQWMIVLLVIFGQRLLYGMADSSPGAAPFVLPVAMAITVFVVMTWIAGSLANLVLMTDRFGRHVLDAEEKRSAVVVGVASLALVVMPGVIWALTHAGLGVRWVMPSVMLPIVTAAVWMVPAGWPRTLVSVAAAGTWVCVAGAWGWIVGMLTGWVDGDDTSIRRALDMQLAGLYLGMGTQIASMVLVNVRVTR